MNPLALLLGCSALALAGTAQASTPVQISLPGINLPSSHQVEGARASFLYGRTGQVKGIDLPVFALSDVDQFTGLQLGIFFGAGRVRHQFGGVAINAVNWHEGQDTGVNLGFVNLTNNVQGLNWGGGQHRPRQCLGQRRLCQLCRAHHLPAWFHQCHKTP